MIDPQGSAATLELPGVHTTADPTGRTWPSAAETIRFVPTDPFDLDVYDEVYSTLRARVVDRVWPALAILCDEAEIVLPATGATSSKRRRDCQSAGAARAVVYFGRKLSILHIACSTRPRGIAKTLKGNMTHGAFFVLPDADDRGDLAKNLGVPLPQFEAAMTEAVRRGGGQPSNGFLWWDQSFRTLQPRVLAL